MGPREARCRVRMNALVSALSDQDLLARLPEVRCRERRAIAEVIAHLAEVERRRLYLAEACSSMFTFCIERLGYSENEAHTRLQVARLCSRFPEALEALEIGTISFVLGVARPEGGRRPRRAQRGFNRPGRTVHFRPGIAEPQGDGGKRARVARRCTGEDPEGNRSPVGSPVSPPRRAAERHSAATNPARAE